MRYLVQHWSLDPFAVLVAVVAVAHELGLARLRRRSLPAHTRRRRLLSIFFYAGLVLLVVGVDSPLAYWATEYFYLHVAEHLVLAFYAPLLLVAGAPWIPLVFAVPVGWRRRAGRALLLGRSGRALRSVGRVLGSPWFAVIAFNAVMVLWHLPVLLDAAERSRALHVWVMDASFVVVGILFWLIVVPSRPFRVRASVMFQAGAIIGTNVVMFVLAMSLSIFTSHNLYPVYAHVPGVTLAPFADQQLGAAILWVCGDVWALPALTLVLRRAIDKEGSLADAVDRLFHRPAMPDLEQFRPPS